jgi:hypothetical protein
MSQAEKQHVVLHSIDLEGLEQKMFELQHKYRPHGNLIVTVNDGNECTYYQMMELKPERAFKVIEAPDLKTLAQIVEPLLVVGFKLHGPLITGYGEITGAFHQQALYR